MNNGEQMLKMIRNLFKCRRQQCNLPVVSGSKVHRITQIQKHLENGDIKFTRTPLFEPPKLIIGCDLAAEGTSDYSVTVSVCYNRDCFYYDKTDNTCVGNYKTCTVKQTGR